MLRTAFLFLFLILTANHAKGADNCELSFLAPYHQFKDWVQGGVGGAGSCGTPTSQQIRNYDCANKFISVGQLVETEDSLNRMAVEMYFQSLAANSHKQALCRTKFFHKYAADSNARAQLNAKAESEFQKIVKELRPVVLERDKVQQEFNFERTRSNMEHDRALTANTQKKRQKRIDQLNSEIVKALVHVPLGYDSDMVKLLTTMVRDNKFDKSAYEQMMPLAATKYQKALEYYRGKYDKASGYCLGLDYKDMAGKSKQMQSWMSSLPNKTNSDKQFRNKLQCRLNAHYDTGAWWVDKSILVASYASYALPSTWLAKLGIRGVVTASKIVNGGLKVGAAALSVMYIDTVVGQCLPQNASWASSQDCSEQAAFDHVMAEPNLTSCAWAGATALGLPMMAR